MNDHTYLAISDIKDIRYNLETVEYAVRELEKATDNETIKSNLVTAYTNLERIKELAADIQEEIDKINSEKVRSVR